MSRHTTYRASGSPRPGHGSDHGFCATKRPGGAIKRLPRWSIGDLFSMESLDTTIVRTATSAIERALARRKLPLHAPPRTGQRGAAEMSTVARPGDRTPRLDRDGLTPTAPPRHPLSCSRSPRTGPTARVECLLPRRVSPQARPVDSELLSEIGRLVTLMSSITGRAAGYEGADEHGQGGEESERRGNLAGSVGGLSD